MPVTTTTAMTAVVVANSATATANLELAAHAARVHRENCDRVIGTRTSDKLYTATEQRDYAHCLLEAYPEPAGSSDESATKAAVLIILLGFFVGAWLGWRNTDRFMGRLANVAMGMLVGTVAGGVLVMVAVGLRFVFS